MSLRDDWKKTGSDLGHAFAGLGKNIGRSAKDGVDYATDAVSDNKEANENKETVYNDGSWRKTGKDLGGAFKGLAHSLLESAETGLSKLDGDKEKKDQQ